MPETVINGCRHHWEEAGAGAPLVMLHGASSSSVALAEAAAELSRTYRVITPDMRGMGRSERVETMPPSAWVDDLVALLDRLDLGEVHLYGYTVGARVAQRLAIDHADRVSTLILDSPIVYNEPEAQQNIASQFDVSSIPDKRKERFRVMHGDDWEVAVSNYHRVRAQPDLQAYLDLRELIGRISAPTMIMRGDARGGGYTADHAFMLYRAVAGAQLWIRPDTAAVLIQSALEETCLQIDRFISQAKAS